MFNSIITGSTGDAFNFHDDGFNIEYCLFFNNENNFYGSQSYYIPANIGQLSTINANGDSCDIYNNIYLDPEFNSTTGDSAFFLTANSPCIDAGNPYLSPDPDSTIRDIGVYYFNQSLSVSKNNNISDIPDTYTLQQNYPNPFNPSTTIRFDLPQAGNASLIIYDTQGREVVRLIDSWQPAGFHVATFDASGLSSGMYFARLTAGNSYQTRKLLLIK